jgi:hypothetical protein
VKYSQENEANNLFWILKFEDKHELEIWKVFINSRIYWCYLNNIKQNEDDINKYNLFLNDPIYNNWNEGLIKKEFYEYIHDVDVNKDGQIKGKNNIKIFIHSFYLFIIIIIIETTLIKGLTIKIRTLPFIDSPETGNFVHEFNTIEVNQIITRIIGDKIVNSGTYLCLRLADDR